jgi:Domain of unknown function (DUF5666)
MKRILTLPLALAMTATAWAHNGMEHVMGTIAVIKGASLDIKTGSGPLKTVITDDKTMWMKGKVMITAKDLHVGDRVVVHAKPVNGKLVAAEVEVGSAPATAHTH